MLKKKLKVISIHSEAPAYEMYENTPRPKINWNIDSTKWVGIWGYDWSDQIGNHILNVTNEVEYEVYQPDLKADKIYSHTFKNGMVHKLFPAKENHGEIESLEMIEYIKTSELDNSTIFHLAYPLHSKLNKGILENFGNNKIVLTFHGEINLPWNALFKFQKNIFRKIKHLKHHFQLKKAFSLVNHVTYQSQTNLSTLRYYYNGKKTELTMGIDTSFFYKTEKLKARKLMGLPIEKKILLSVSRLNSHKQIDKVIDTLGAIKVDYVFVIIGKGIPEYETYLRKKINHYNISDKVLLMGYKSGEELRNYFNASDLFLQTSLSEAGPVSAIEAAACELPILTTDTGNLMETLNRSGAGVIVKRKDYNEWRNVIEKFLKNEISIKVLDRNIVVEKYDWKVISKKIIEIYKN